MGVLDELKKEPSKNLSRREIRRDSRRNRSSVNGNGKGETYLEKNGTTRVGDALRWLKDSGKAVAPELLDIAGTLTGIKGLKAVGNAIRGDSILSESDKAYALKQLELDMIEAQEITKRWEADMHSDSWLSKNIRPMTLAFLVLTTITIIALDSALDTFKVEQHWITLLMTLDVTALGGYFALRQWGQNTKVREGL